MVNFFSSVSFAFRCSPAFTRRSRFASFPIYPLFTLRPGQSACALGTFYGRRKKWDREAVFHPERSGSFVYGADLSHRRSFDPALKLNSTSGRGVSARREIRRGLPFGYSRDKLDLEALILPFGKGVAPAEVSGSAVLSDHSGAARDKDTSKTLQQVNFVFAGFGKFFGFGPIT